MRLDEWRFSAKLAWQDGFIRWATIGSAALNIFFSTYALWRLIPIGLRSGVLTMHYNIYLGIDDVQPWSRILLLPAIMLAIITLNAGISFGIYRRDALAAKALTGLSVALSLLWSVSLFFLVMVNL